MKLRDVEKRTREFAGSPDVETPNREVVLTHICTVVDSLAKLANHFGKPQLVDKFTLSVTPTRSEYAVPVENFDQLYHATSLIDGHELAKMNFPDANLLGLSANPQAQATGGRASHIGMRGSGEDRRVLIFPRGASDTLQIWYEITVPTPETTGLDDELTLMEQFHGVLVPAGAALALMHLWRWRGKSPQETAEMKAGMLDLRNPLSTLGVYDTQLSFFRERAQNPTVIEPSNKLRGFGHARRQARQSGGRWR